MLPVVTKVINESLEHAKFHDSWKRAVVKPLIKNSNLEPIYKNYRPVSNLCFVSKLTEKAFILQLKEHLDSNNLHSVHQSAYKPNFSTETAICYLVNNLLWNMEKGDITVMVAIDLSSAFDTVDHNILSNVLRDNFGVKGKALDWANSYLTDRQLQVKVGKHYSSVQTFNYSVPQGSCLGPIFFNIYSSSIIDCISGSQRIGGYADDHFIYDSFSAKSSGGESRCMKNLEKTLSDVEKWMEANTLKMNTSKTEFTLIGSCHFLNNVSTSSITVGTDKVDAKPLLKHLGVWLDQTLSFKHHIKLKCQTAAANIRKIAMIRRYIDIDTAKQLATALVLSHLDYSNCILCGLPDSSIELLQKMQNWAAKVVLQKSKFDSSTDALKHLHWLPIKARIDYKIACLTFKCLEKSAPASLSNLIKLRQFSRSTRASTTDSHKLEVPFTRRSTFADRSFSVYGLQLWNTLPQELRRLSDFKLFKKRLKTFLFTKSFYGCSTL